MEKRSKIIGKIPVDKLKAAEREVVEREILLEVVKEIVDEKVHENENETGSGSKSKVSDENIMKNKLEKNLIGEVENEVEDEVVRHHRICAGVIDGRPMSHICCLDNAETDTQATVWADFTHKQVSEKIVLIVVFIKNQLL